MCVAIFHIVLKLAVADCLQIFHSIFGLVIQSRVILLSGLRSDRLECQQKSICCMNCIIDQYTVTRIRYNYE